MTAARSAGRANGQTAKRQDKLRIQLRGQRTTRELLDMFEQAMRKAEERGLLRADLVSVYMRPIDDAGTEITMTAGQARDIVVKKPYQSAADEYDAP
jgi:hypothetical protein